MDKEQFFQAVHEFNDHNPQRALVVLCHVGESFTDKSLESAVRWVHEASDLGAHRLGHAIALGIDPGSLETSTRPESVADRRDQLRYDLRHAAGLRKYGVSVTQAAIRAGCIVVYPAYRSWKDLRWFLTFGIAFLNQVTINRTFLGCHLYQGRKGWLVFRQRSDIRR